MRPVEPSDALALHALLSRPDVAPWAGRTRFDSVEVTKKDLARKGPHRLATFATRAAGSAVMTAYGEVTVVPRPRMSHVALLKVVGEDAGARGVLDALVALADGWLGVSKLEAEVDAEDPVIPALIARGFAEEVRKRAARSRGGTLVDSVILGRFLPGFVPRGPATRHPDWPPPGEPVAVSFRAMRPDDLSEFAALHRAPSVVWGTLQLPTGSDEAWRERLGNNDVIGQHSLVGVTDSGEIVTSGGVHRHAFPSEHGATFGMAVKEGFQGRRVGGRMLDALVSLAFHDLGLCRLDLEVYDDNPRAIALYKSRGFVPEGVRRYNALRDGAHAHSLVMAIVR